MYIVVTKHPYYKISETPFVDLELINDDKNYFMLAVYLKPAAISQTLLEHFASAFQV